MTWTRVSDDFADDCWTLSDAAFRLHLEGIVWSNRKLLDCRLPKGDVRRFKTPEAVRELVDGGWWADEGAVYVIRHHATYQRTRDAVLQQQAANQQNGRKGGRPRTPTRERIASHSVSESVSGGSASGRPTVAAGERAETESVSDSKTERDRPGLVRTGTEGEPTATGAWPPVRVVGRVPR